jgi:NADPH:quinone reductase-like Zn-dependent oxidoreductase
MKAIQVTRFGGPEVLALADLPDPAPGPGQVAIDVTHAAVGLIDVYIRQGLYRDRAGLPRPPYVPGLEVAGTVRGERMGAAAASRLPYDAIVDSARLPGALDGQKFDVIIDPVGGAVRTESLDLLAPFGRLLLVGNASGDWDHRIDSNRIWYGNITVSGFNSGGYLPAHPETVRPAAAAALQAVAAGLSDTEVEVLPLAEAATAHERLESHVAGGRLVLSL